MRKKGKQWQDRKDSGVRIVQFSPDKHDHVWNINKKEGEFHNDKGWDLIASKLRL